MEYLKGLESLNVHQHMLRGLLEVSKTVTFHLVYVQSYISTEPQIQSHAVMLAPTLNFLHLAN